MPRYIEVIAAAGETATKILTLRASRDTGRHVVVTTKGGKTASVQWSDDTGRVMLHMPSLPADAMLTRAEADRLVAFIGHECCHVLHSSKSVWEEAVRAGDRVRDWTNALEDVRIEAAEISAGVFPALGGLLAGILNHLHYETLTGRGGKTIARDARNAPYVACVLGRLANGYTVPAAAGLAASQSAAVRRLTDVALAGLPACKSTADVLDLARRIVALEGAGRRRPDKPQGDESQEEPQEEGQESQESQESQEEPQESQESQESQEEGQESQESQEEGQESQESPEGSEEPQESQGSIGTGRDTDANLSGTIARIAERAGLTLRDIADVPAGAELSTAQVTVRATAYGRNDVGNTTAATMLDRLLPRNALLSGQIGRLLVSAEVRRVTHRESSGRLDRRALTRLSVGAADVYSRRDDVDGIDTALMVLIDGSISMNAMVSVNPHATRMDLAQVAAWHIAKAAEAAGAKVALAAFHDYGDKHVTIVKPWNVPAGDCATALAAIDARGGTPLAPSILAGAGLIAAVSATRRILMVLTDGECAFGADAVRAACRIAGDDRVEVVGIGMNCATVAAAFPPRYSVNVEDLTQLAAAGLGVLTTMLEEANPRGAD